jgi:hypothetical protein
MVMENAAQFKMDLFDYRRIEAKSLLDHSVSGGNNTGCPKDSKEGSVPFVRGDQTCSCPIPVIGNYSCLMVTGPVGGKGRQSSHCVSISKLSKKTKRYP